MLLCINRMILRALLLSLAACACMLASTGARATDSSWSCLPGGGGRLEMRITGAFETELAWGNEGTRCDGGPRPAGDALRLMFSRDDDNLLVVLGITGLERGATATGLLANLTLVREGMGEFFGTLGAHACVVDVAENSAVAGTDDAWRVAGEGRCESPIGAINREGELRIPTFVFAGLASWPDEESADD
jgi:hypothetical protein